jgi:aspartate aminotransferase
MKRTPLSRRVANLEESATLALNARATQLKAEGRTIYNFTAGELDGPTPLFIQKKLATELEHNKYTPTPGRLSLREAIASYETKRLGRKVRLENVVVTSGAKSGLYGLLQVLLNSGDEVILPTPAWVSYAHMIELAGGKVVQAPLKPDNDIDPSSILKAITPKTKVIIINSPNNPTGAVFSGSALKQLISGIKKRPIMVISDEIYSTLSYDAIYKPLTKLGLPLENQLIVNGFSKSQALTGWRIGYVIAPAEIASVLNSFLSHAMGNASLPAQLAAEAALAKGNKPTMYKILERRRKLVETHLKKIPGIIFTKPGGAFYFWLDIRAISKNSLSWCEELLNETGVALVPGEAFFAPGFARLSFAADDKLLKEGLEKLAAFVESGS